MKKSADELNQISNSIIGAAIEVHRHLGPGLLESAYRQCLAWELQQQSLVVEQEILVPIKYKQLEVENGYRIDLLVEHEVVIELMCCFRSIARNFLRISRLPGIASDYC
jgi:GxxExxY protein